MKKYILFLLLLNCISLISSLSVNLTNPYDNYAFFGNSAINFQGTAYDYVGYIKNMSLWTNQTGTWKIDSNISANPSFVTNGAATQASGSADGDHSTGGVLFQVGTQDVDVINLTRNIGQDPIRAWIVQGQNCSILNNLTKPCTFDGSGNCYFERSIHLFRNTNYSACADGVTVSYFYTWSPPAATGITWIGGIYGETGLLTNRQHYINNISFYVDTIANATFSFNIFSNKIWNIQACNNSGSCNFANNNFTITGSNIFENSRTYNLNTISGATETFILNFSAISFTSLDFIYNNTFYNVSINSLGGNNYIATTTITVPNVLTNQNKTLYWSFDNGIFNTVSTNQSINPFQIDNCLIYSNILLNYTIYDEDTQTIIPAINNLSTQVSLNLFNLDYNTLLATFSLNSNNSNTKVCIGNLGSGSYYIDVVVQYDGGDNYVTRFNNIQKQFINSTIPTITVPLYDLLTSRSQEFLITFKDSNFLPDPNVLVDVTRKYVSEGVFKTVEVPITDGQGQTLAHLVLGDVIYTFNFKKNGQILTILDNVRAKCDNIAQGQCSINVNAFSGNLVEPDFNFNNGLNVMQFFDKSTKTISMQFTTQTGITNFVTLNVTKIDRFGNTTICSSNLLSSSGSINCIIPDSFGNITVISKVYNNGVLSSQAIFSMGGSPTDNYGSDGSTIIISIIIVITLSMLFISDTRGILLGSFIGLLLSGLLVFINSGSLFSVGAAIGYALVAIVLILFKLNQKEER